MKTGPGCSDHISCLMCRVTTANKWNILADQTPHIAEFIVGRIKSKCDSLLYFSLNRGLYGDKFIVRAITGPRCLDINNSHNKIVLIIQSLGLFSILWCGLMLIYLCAVAVLMNVFLLPVLTGPIITAVVSLHVVVVSSVTIVLVWVALVGVPVHHP